MNIAARSEVGTVLKLDELRQTGCRVIVRPHPQQVRHQKAYFEQLKTRYAADENVEIQTDFSSNATVFESDLLITDWSDIAWEFCYTTKKPVLFIDTPMKVMNPDWQKIEEPPMNIAARSEVGTVLKLDELDRTAEAAEALLAQPERYRAAITQSLKSHVYHPGHSAEAEGKYIISAIQKKIRERKESKTT